ncbi:TetR/AcrR family transcriptional regulator [Actinomadura sediminis]|uniref:TetR/AcrR family transcriptional regulator n=1 Tax=Actinomadura sediminis TaxID=1038904 RepID=A0ABW3EJ84_9ACTN
MLTGMTRASPPNRRPRRSPASAERRRDPERTRERILDAAVHELADKGPTQIRVAAIAERAGVNKQLISYYFGGKDGLLRAIGQRWRDQKRAYDAPDVPLAEVMRHYARAAGTHRLATRLLGWEGLTYTDAADDPDREARRHQAEQDLADLRRRQDAGEIADDIDPACLFLALLAAASAPVLLPHMTHSICDTDPASAEFVEHYAEQLARIVAHLTAPPRNPNADADAT